MDWHKSTNPFTALCKDLRILNSPPGKKEVGKFFLIKRKGLVKGFIRITGYHCVIPILLLHRVRIWGFLIHLPEKRSRSIFSHKKKRLGKGIYSNNGVPLRCWCFILLVLLLNEKSIPINPFDYVFQITIMSSCFSILYVPVPWSFTQLPSSCFVFLS